MNTIKDLEYSNFIELVEYLKSISGEENEDGKMGFVLNRMGNFFPELTSLQELELGYVLDNLDKEKYERFRDNNPDIRVDETGKSSPSKKDYWMIKEKALNHLFDMAQNNLKSKDFKDNHPDRLDTQVHNAKTLSPLKNMQKQDSIAYAFKRALFFKKFSFMPAEDFVKYEKHMEELGVEDYTVFLNYFLSYCYNKKYKNFSIFFEHVLKRIEILYSDKDLKSQFNKDFLEAIKSIVNKNN